MAVLVYFLIAGWDRWHEQYRLGNGDSLWIVCGEPEDGNGRLSFSPGIDPWSGTVRCRIDRR
jgi:hypothetical protein